MNPPPNLIGNARVNRTLKGVKITSSKIIYHLLFIDNILLFNADSPQEFEVLNVIIDL